MASGGSYCRDRFLPAINHPQTGILSHDSQWKDGIKGGREEDPGGLVVLSSSRLPPRPLSHLPPRWWCLPLLEWWCWLLLWLWWCPCLSSLPFPEDLSLPLPRPTRRERGERQHVSTTTNNSTARPYLLVICPTCGCGWGLVLALVLVRGWACVRGRSGRRSRSPPHTARSTRQCLLPLPHLRSLGSQNLTCR